jgi:hypothetical protein
MKLNLPILAVGFAVLTSLSLPANAEIPIPANQWHSVAQDAGGNLYQVDQGTIQNHGYVKTYWVQTLFNQGEVSRQYMAVNCATNIYSTGWVVIANNQGQIVVNTSLEQSNQQVAAGTINDALTNAVCTGFISDPQLAALTRARQSSANAITEAMKAGMIGIK